MLAEDGRLILVRHNLLDDDSHLAIALDMTSENSQVVYLAVVGIAPAVLQRIEGGLQHVVEVAAASVRREQCDDDCQTPRQRLHAILAADGDDLQAECLALVADADGTVAITQPVGVDGRRIRQVERHATSYHAIPIDTQAQQAQNDGTT